MNWKFWRWPGQIRTLKRDCAVLQGEVEGQASQVKIWQQASKKASGEIEQLDKDVSKLETANAHLRALLRFQQEGENRALQNIQIMRTLAAVNDENELWKAVFQIIANQQADELQGALAPNLLDGAAHYQRGRAAALADLRGILMQLRERAQSKDAA